MRRLQEAAINKYPGLALGEKIRSGNATLIGDSITMPSNSSSFSGSLRPRDFGRSPELALRPSSSRGSTSIGSSSSLHVHPDESFRATTDNEASVENESSFLPRRDGRAQVGSLRLPVQPPLQLSNTSPQSRLGGYQALPYPRFGDYSQAPPRSPYQMASDEFQPPPVLDPPLSFRTPGVLGSFGNDLQPPYLTAVPAPRNQQSIAAAASSKSQQSARDIQAERAVAERIRAEKAKAEKAKQEAQKRQQQRKWEKRVKAREEPRKAREIRYAAYTDLQPQGEESDDTAAMRNGANGRNDLEECPAQRLLNAVFRYGSLPSRSAYLAELSIAKVKVDTSATEDFVRDREHMFHRRREEAARISARLNELRERHNAHPAQPPQPLQFRTTIPGWMRDFLRWAYPDHIPNTVSDRFVHEWMLEDSETFRQIDRYINTNERPRLIIAQLVAYALM
jgi:hypothetical protein